MKCVRKNAGVRGKRGGAASQTYTVYGESLTTENLLKKMTQSGHLSCMLCVNIPLLLGPAMKLAIGKCLVLNKI